MNAVVSPALKIVAGIGLIFVSASGRSPIKEYRRVSAYINCDSGMYFIVSSCEKILFEKKKKKMFPISNNECHTLLGACI